MGFAVMRVRFEDERLTFHLEEEDLKRGPLKGVSHV